MYYGYIVVVYGAGGRAFRSPLPLTGGRRARLCRQSLRDAPRDNMSPLWILLTLLPVLGKSATPRVRTCCVKPPHCDILEVTGISNVLRVNFLLMCHDKVMLIAEKFLCNFLHSLYSVMIFHAAFK